ncbi:MAG: hypothetical protein H6Q78_1780 [Candidatus Krumholzibacteriota bacterium]|nr:hypothetical protein [Candidatus Krumholzibacteriota bacterium]
MTKKAWHRLAIGAFALAAGAAPLSALFLTPDPAGSTPDLMSRLPSYQKFRCDGTFDYAGAVVEHSNPGDGRDCSIALTQQTWGKIKEVFRSELPDYLDFGDLFADESEGDE